jgi:DNA-binding NtrC family response regulator
MSLRPTVLIIDDAAGTRHGLGQLLELRGYDTREARNGAHGLAILRSEPGIRLVVLDLWMPVSDGSWFRERQLDDPTIAHIPVVVFTGAADAETLRTTLRIEHILYKPVSIDALLDIVARYCAA